MTSTQARLTCGCFWPPVAEHQMHVATFSNFHKAAVYLDIALKSAPKHTLWITVNRQEANNTASR